METNIKETPSEDAGDGYPIEIYADERIRDFLAEDELTPEEIKRLEEKLKESIKLNSSPPSERS